MAYHNEAVDFSLFEDRTAAVVLEPKIEEQPRRRDNVVELPERKRQEEPEKQRKPQRRPLRMIAGALCFAVMFATGIGAVYSEVQLTELTEEINRAQTQLDEAQSLEVQLTMQAAQKMTDAQVEEYAAQQLGMGKLLGSQVVYLHVAQQDRGTVVQEVDSGSWLDQFLAWIRSCFAG